MKPLLVKDFEERDEWLEPLAVESLQSHYNQLF